LSGGLLGDLGCAEDGTTWRWTGQVWEAVQRKKGIAAVSEWIYKQRADEASRRKAVDAWDFAADLLARRAPKPPRAVDRIVLPTRGAYLHVHDDGRITAAAPDRALGLTHAIAADCPAPVGAAYTPAPVPDGSLFGRFLARVQPDPAVRALVQEQASITFTTPAQRCVAWWSGSGANGKSAMAALIAAFHSRMAAVDLHALGDRFGLSGIVGASLLLVSEVSEDKPWAEERWKALVAGDPVPVEGKGRDIVEFRSTAKMIVTAQQPPFYKDKSDGVRSRLVPVAWTETIPDDEQDPDLVRKIIEDEAGIVLDWILAGLVRIAQRGGRFMPRAEWPAAVLDLWHAGRRNNDPLRAWVDESGAVYDPTMRPRPKSDITAAWRAWCRRQGHVDRFGEPPLAGESFWRALRKMPEFALLATAPAKVLGRGAERVPAIQIDFRPPAGAVDMTDALDPLD
jgi:putative DNA primase/helicase